MRRLFNRRVIFRLLGTLITLYALFVVIENWTGHRALAAAKARFLAAGETLDFTAVVPPPPPETQNFCAIEPLAGLTDSKRKPAESLEALDWTSLTIAGLDSIRLGKAPDLNPLMEHLVAKGIGKKGTSPTEMLAALDATHPVLKSLAEVARQRPAAQFIPMIGDGRPDITHSEIHYTHFTQSQRLSNALLLRCNLAIAAGNPSEAVKCIQASLRLAEAHFQEPLLLGQLVAGAIQARTVSRVWALLHARIASETELITLQRDFARLDLLTALLQATRGELAVATHSLASHRLRPELKSGLFGEHKEAPGAESEPSLSNDLLDMFLPPGFHEHSEAHVITHCLDHLILPMKDQDFQTLFPAFERLEKRIKENRHITSPHKWMAALNMGTHSFIIERLAESETRRRQALAAIAIERIRQTTGALPASLPEGHLDFIDGKPMRYRVEGTGYLLWSIALNNTDDGGKDHPRSASRKGDWVWQMPAGH